MAKNGHWYTDKQGNHYFVEEGQTPKEGWEASKRRKMISGGKYKVSEDGNDYRDVDMDEYNKYEADEDEWDATRDEDIDGFDEEGDIEYNREMQKAQEENAAMSEGKDEEKYSDFIGEDGQVKPDKREERDAFLERKDKEASKIITDAGMKDVNLTAALKLKNDYAEGKITKEELVNKYREHFKNDKNIVGSQGENNNLPGAKPSSVGNRLKFKLPNQEEQVGTIESLDESGINAFGKKQKMYVVRTPDGRRIEVPGEYVVKPEYPGGMGDYVYDINNPDYGESKRKHRPTPNQKAYTPEQRQAIRDQINKMVASLDDARSVDEAWDIEQGVIELEEMLKKYKGE